MCYYLPECSYELVVRAFSTGMLIGERFVNIAAADRTYPSPGINKRATKIKPPQSAHIPRMFASKVKQTVMLLISLPSWLGP